MLQPDSCEYSLVSGMPTFNLDGLVKSPSIPHSGRVGVVPRYAGLNSLQMAGEG
jgi:hypothetical protein